MTTSLDIERRDGVAHVTPRGHLDLQSTSKLYAALGELVEEANLDGVVVDFEAVDQIDSSGIAAIGLAADHFARAEMSFEIVNLDVAQREAFAMMPARPDDADSGPPRMGFFESIGAQVAAFIEEARAFSLLAIDALIVTWRAIAKREFPPKGAYTEQAVAIGVDAFPIVGLLSLLLGLILAFQAAFQLQRFGANIFVANLVGISMVREFGPIMTGIIVAGRSGSAIAAELGTMVVQEEIDALRTMGIDHNRFLVLPKLLALLTMQPALTLFANVIGIFGGFVIAVLYLDLAPATYIDQSIRAIQVNDWLHGIFKSFVFAAIIGFVGCYNGLHLEGGASAVGRATTRAVVTSIFLLIVADSIFATVSTIMKGG